MTSEYGRSKADGARDDRVYPGAAGAGRDGSDGETGAPARWGRRVAPAVLAAVSCALIAVAVALGGGPSSGGDLLRTTAPAASSAGSAAGGAGASAEAAGKAGGGGDAGEKGGGGSSASAADASSGFPAAGGSGAPASDGSSAGSSESAPDGTPGANAPSSSPAGDGQIAAPSGGGANPAPSATDRSDLITVRVVVGASAAGGGVLADAALTFDKGATAYDALMGTGLSVNARDSVYGVYVTAIGGYAEFVQGGESGWKYAVNGSYPGTSAGNYALSDGDVLRWVYVTHA